MSNANFCGFDFGTSNSTIGIYKNDHCQLALLENNQPLIRSAIYANNAAKEFNYGQTAIDNYFNEGDGRLLMSLKSVLGSALMNEKTYVFDKFISYTDILGLFINHIKKIAEQHLQQELTAAVVGRPVKFHDTDVEKDKLAQNTLATIMQQQGFKQIEFQYEPIAAAKTYEATIKHEELAIIVDMGGGTSDFTIIRLTPNKNRMDRKDDVLANHGIHIAGTDLDRALSLQSIMPLFGLGSLMRGSSSDIPVPSIFYHDLTTWHLLNHLYNQSTRNEINKIYVVAQQKNLIARLLYLLEMRLGHRLLEAVELAKQRLSDQSNTIIDLDFIEPLLQQEVLQIDFNTSITEHTNKILATIQESLALAKTKAEKITAIFFTGGTTKIPFIREKIMHLLPQAKVVRGDAFGSVGLGLTLSAKELFYS